MRLEPGDQQQALVDAVRSVLDDHVPASLHARRDGGPLDRTTWNILGELGLFGVAVPEQSGGLGLGTTALCLALEEVGRSGYAGPVLETAAVVAPLLAGLDDERSALLPNILSGVNVATATLSPTSRLAADVDEAPVIATLGTTVQLDTVEHFDRTEQRSMDSSRRAWAVTPRDARAVPLSDLQRAELHDRVLVTNAALLVGNASALLSAAVTYAGERRQFSRVIGSFQSLKHMLADIHVDIEVARSAVWMAALTLDEQPDTAPRAVASTAAAVAAHAAERANDVALQVHGGIGYTWEHDLQIWLKQGVVLARRLGTAAHHRRRAAQLAGVLPAGASS